MPIDWRKFIESHPRIALGKPVFKGTRLTVQFVLDLLAQGATKEELISDYPPLSLDHIQAALAYAASLLNPE